MSSGRAKGRGSRRPPRATRGLFALAALAAGACGVAGEPIEAPGASPRVVSVSPADGAIGVRRDAPIVVTFDVPMDPAATEGAFVAGALPPPVRFAWDAKRTVLTVRAGDFAYAEGALDTPGRTYGFEIGRGALDALRRPLGATFKASFRTLRRVTHTLVTISTLDGSVRSNGDNADGFCRNGDVAAQLCVGDSAEAPYFYKGFLTFDLSPLPDGIALFEDARLRAYQYSLQLDPYEKMGIVSLEHVVFAKLGGEAFLNGHEGRLGALSRNGDVGWKVSEQNLSAALEKDYGLRKERLNRSQYRLTFTETTDGDGYGDTAKFLTGGVRDLEDERYADKYPRLEARFLAP